MFGRLSEFVFSLKDGSFIRAKDRFNAALLLASFLKDRVKDIQPENLIILGIPRGGIIMAETISNKLDVPYDIVLVKRLRAPNNEELAIGAIMEDGSMYLNKDLINSLNIPKEYIEEEKAKQMEDIRLRNKLYQHYSDFVTINKKKNTINNIIIDKTVIVVDDGAASGATLMVLLKWLKEKSPKEVIVAITVAPKDTIKLLKTETKRIEAIITPSHNFQNVSQYYKDFTQITHEQVIEILKSKSII